MRTCNFVTTSDGDWCSVHLRQGDLCRNSADTTQPTDALRERLRELINAIALNASEWLEMEDCPARDIAYTTLRAHALALREDYNDTAQAVLAERDKSQITVANVPDPVEAYPGQAYFHANNPNIKAAEERAERDKQVREEQRAICHDIYYDEGYRKGFAAAKEMAARKVQAMAQDIHDGNADASDIEEAIRSLEDKPADFERGN